MQVIQAIRELAAMVATIEIIAMMASTDNNMIYRMDRLVIVGCLNDAHRKEEFSTSL
jgi:hypothetical protein